MATIQVILKDKIDGLGAEADVVTVKSGYARNYLIPSGKAIEATKGNLQRVATLQAKRAEREAQEFAALQSLATKIKKLTLTFELATGQEGKAFGSVTAHDILNELTRKGIEVDRRALQLDNPIKKTGTVEIPIRLHQEITQMLKVSVKAKKEEK